MTPAEIETIHKRWADIPLYTSIYTYDQPSEVADALDNAIPDIAALLAEIDRVNADFAKSLDLLGQSTVALEITQRRTAEFAAAANAELDRRAGEIERLKEDLAHFNPSGYEKP